MKFTVTYTLEDYIAAQKLHLKTSKNGWVIRWAFPFIGSGTLIGLILRYVTELPPTPFQTFYFGVLGIFFLIFPLVVVQVSTRSLFKKSKFLKIPTEFEITEDEIRVTNELNVGSIKWPLFVRYAMNDEMLILMSTPRTMYMIPRKYISSLDEWNTLTTIVKSKVPNK